MDTTFLLRGLVIGFSIAAPVGPIAVLCMRRTLAEGRLAGLVSGLGAATADAIYGGIAGLGLTLISNFLISQQAWLCLAGGLFLCHLGIKIFLENPSNNATLTSTKGIGIVGDYVSTFFLTLTNPMTILSFAAIFAGFGLASINGNFLSAGSLILGVFAGSAFWWFILSCSVGIFREKLNLRELQWINRVSGIIITGFGLFSLLRIMGFVRIMPS